MGNGRLGAIVFGRVGRERIQLNEDTIWNGRKRDRVNPEALKALPEVRRLLFDGRATEAETLEDEKLVGIPHRQPVYQPLGDLDIEFSGLENASDYRRELNLATGIVRVSYRVGGASCTRVASSKKHGHDNRAAGARTGARADWRDIDDGHAGRGSFGDQLFSSSRQS